MDRKQKREVAIDVDNMNRQRSVSEIRAEYDRRQSLGQVTRY